MVTINGRLCQRNNIDWYACGSRLAGTPSWPASLQLQCFGSQPNRQHKEEYIHPYYSGKPTGSLYAPSYSAINFHCLVDSVIFVHRRKFG